MPKASSRAALSALILPFTLCSLPMSSQAAESSRLNTLVAQLLEREGIIEPGTAPSTRAARFPTATVSADVFETSAQTASVMPVDDNAHKDEAATVLGVVLIFADAEAKELSAQNLPAPAALVDALKQVTEVPLTFQRAMAMGAFVFAFDQPLTMQAFNALQRQLETLDVVEALYPDLLQMPERIPRAAPFYYYQWSLRPANAYSDSLKNSVLGMDVERAWDLTTGSSDMTIAVLDSGLADPHPFDPSRVLPGYDFITDSGRARDGDGRDDNPTDMGDHRLEGECPHDSKARRSSWHGTAVASLIANDGDESTGIAGIDWQARLLPVRVLGKCGGATSDIIDGMLWAAGYSVPGVPDNPNRARILNMSLGVTLESTKMATCNPLYQIAFNMIHARDILVVSSAGNDSTDMARHSPAHCDGPLAVSAVDYMGELASYSNWNKDGGIFIAAPGGDVSKHDGWSGIPATKDRGSTEPTGELAQYFTSGTSMAAAQVSGVASLVWSIDPEQRAEVITAILSETVQPFGPDTRCEVEWPLCGPGIIDAWAAVQGAMALKLYSSVIEFYHPDLQHYFSSANNDEVSLVRAGQFGDWRETGEVFLTWRGPSEAGVLPVCRFYGTPGMGPNSHFYTVDPVECEAVKRDPGWTYEGIPFYAKRALAGHCPIHSAPVYRYYNNGWTRNDSNHRYATHLDNQTAMQDAGWVLEGTAMCVPGQS